MEKKQQALNKILYVVNPISGDRDKEYIFELIQKFSEKHNIAYLIVKTSGDRDEVEIEEAIAQFKPEVVAAVGGDGTMNLVAKLIAGKGIVLGIIPMGSGNGLSKDLNIPQNEEKALHLLHQPHISPIDTLTANEKFFMHLCDIGFNARIVKLFNKGKSRGLLSYIRFTSQEFFKYKTSRYKVITDNGTFEGKAFMITVANSNQFGSNLMINPNGKWDDGFFEVIIIKRFPRKMAFRLFLLLLFKRINFSPYCITIKCREAKISCKKKKVFQYDGEIAGEVQAVNLKIYPHNLKVILPKDN